jgi:hypothetical protein
MHIAHELRAKLPTARLEKMRPRPLALSLALMAVTMITGLVTRFAHFELPPVVVKYGGSMLWALLIYWIASTLLPAMRLRALALLTAGITTAVEFFKLYHAPALDAFRMTLPGILLLGCFFSAWDILAYWIAIVAGVLLDRRIRSSLL